METVQIEILHPKAKSLLKKLSDLDLIKINKVKKPSDFFNLLEKLRAKSKDKISFEEITEEVEQVRKRKHEKQEGNSGYKPLD